MEAKTSLGDVEVGMYTFAEMHDRDGGERRMAELLEEAELADRLGLSRPTVHGLLQTLQAHGFVEQDRDSDKYQLGAGLLQLGTSYLDLNELRGRSIVHAERLAARTDAAFKATGDKMQVLKDTADSGKMAYDQMIGANNPEGNKIVEGVVDTLVAQARAVEGVVTALGLAIQLEGSDSLDNPTAVVQ